MNRTGSAVVDVMRKASSDTWRAWRRHVEAGTAASAEAQELWEQATLAGKALLGEMADRARLTVEQRARAA